VGGDFQRFDAEDQQFFEEFLAGEDELIEGGAPAGVPAAVHEGVKRRSKNMSRRDF
jgi:hypothetical protein